VKKKKSFVLNAETPDISVAIFVKVKLFSAIKFKETKNFHENLLSVKLPCQLFANQRAENNFNDF
jgi:hypothetical protein